MTPKTTIHYSQLQPTKSIDRLLDEENYDARRRFNLARRASIAMNKFINKCVKEGQHLPTDIMSRPALYMMDFSVRNRHVVLASMIRFDHIKENGSVVLSGELYIAGVEEQASLLNYLKSTG